MLTDTNYSTCCGTLFLVQEITVITVITVKTFEKTRLRGITDYDPTFQLLSGAGGGAGGGRCSISFLAELSWGGSFLASPSCLVLAGKSHIYFGRGRSPSWPVLSWETSSPSGYFYWKDKAIILLVPGHYGIGTLSLTDERRKTENITFPRNTYVVKGVHPREIGWLNMLRVVRFLWLRRTFLLMICFVTLVANHYSGTLVYWTNTKNSTLTGFIFC